jgi:hypothetical protein
MNGIIHSSYPSRSRRPDHSPPRSSEALPSFQCSATLRVVIPQPSLCRTSMLTFPGRCGPSSTLSAVTLCRRSGKRSPSHRRPVGRGVLYSSFPSLRSPPRSRRSALVRRVLFSALRAPRRPSPLSAAERQKTPSHRRPVGRGKLTTSPTVNCRTSSTANFFTANFFTANFFTVHCPLLLPPLPAESW